jgi:hypothetical protein
MFRKTAADLCLLRGLLKRMSGGSLSRSRPPLYDNTVAVQHGQSKFPDTLRASG